MPADIEWVVGVLRVGNGFQKHGDPYEFSCTLNVRGDEAELIGGSGEVTRKIWRDIREALIAQGVQRAHWRRKNGVPRSCIVDRDNRLSVTVDGHSSPSKSREETVAEAQTVFQNTTVHWPGNSERPTADGHGRCSGQAHPRAQQARA